MRWRAAANALSSGQVLLCLQDVGQQAVLRWQAPRASGGRGRQGLCQRLRAARAHLEVRVKRREEEEEEEEESFSGAKAVNEEDPERDRATQV